MRNIDKDGLKEIGKGVIAFANILTALLIVNVIYNNANAILYSILTIFSYTILYYIGYNFIRKGNLWLK